MALSDVKKPVNAGWAAKVTVSPDGDGTVSPGDAPTSQAHQFRDVEIAWYGLDRVKITFKDGGAANLRQFYSGDGKNVIIDVQAR